MLYFIIQSIVISILFIFLVHHLIHFFQSMLTVPKIKDLVNTSNQKYENIYNLIKEKSISKNNNNINDNNNEYTLIDLLPSKEEDYMKNELKNFLKTQLKTI